MELIGLSGYARSGKDTAAAVLVEEFGFTRIAFADKLREFLLALDPIVSMRKGEWSHALDAQVYRFVRLREVIEKYGWDGYKSTAYGQEIRALLQRLGTEAGREVLWDTIWIDAAFHGLDPDGKYVVTDCRFPNEAAAVRNRGGKMVRVQRSGVGPANTHPSETSLDDYDFDLIIHNTENLEGFQYMIRSLVDAGRL